VHVIVVVILVVALWVYYATFDSAMFWYLLNPLTHSSVTGVKAVIVGMTRDDDYGFHRNKYQIEELGSMFADYRVILVENDSAENYVDQLNHWSLNNRRVKIISKKFNLQKRPTLKFLAGIRNLYIEELLKPEYDSFDKVIVVDIDMTHRWPIHHVVASAVRDEVAVRCAHIYEQGSGFGHRDVLAFRSREYVSDYELLGPSNVARHTRTFVYKLTTDLFLNQDVIPVDSCFGGMAIYSKAVFGPCKYNDLVDECEHILFHQCIRDTLNLTIVLDTSVAFPFHERTLKDGVFRLLFSKLPVLIFVACSGALLSYLIFGVQSRPNIRLSAFITVLGFVLLNKRTGENSFEPYPGCMVSPSTFWLHLMLAIMAQIVALRLYESRTRRPNLLHY